MRCVDDLIGSTGATPNEPEVMIPSVEDDDFFGRDRVPRVIEFDVSAEEVVRGLVRGAL